MVAGIRRDGLSCWKFVANILIFLFIVREVASLIESDVSGRTRNTTCSLRVTRQKVLIQEVENSENKRRTRRKYGSDNGDGYMSPDIVVEEFRIRAKINFQARPRTCRDTLTAISNDNKSLIGSSSSRDRRIVNCHAESLIPKNATEVEVGSLITHSNDKSINIDKKSVLSENTTHLPNKIIFNGPKTVKLKNNQRKIQEKFDRDDREIEKSAKKVNKDFFSRKKKKLHRFTTDKKEFLKKIYFDNREIFGIKNEELEKPKRLSVLYDSEEKIRMNSQGIDASGFHSRYRKSTENMKYKVIDSRIKRTTQYSDITKKEFLGKNKDHFTHESKQFFTSDKVDNKMDKISKWKKNVGTRQIKSMNNKIQMDNANVLPFFDDYEIVEIKSNKLDRPRPLSVSYNYKKLHKVLKGNKNSDISQSCHRNSTKSYTIPLRLKKREANIEIPSVTSFSDEHEKFNIKYDHFDNSTPLSVSNNSNETFHNDSNANDKLVSQSHKKSLKNPKNNTTVANKNSQEKTAKQSVNKNKKKKSRTETSSKKLQSKASKASASKTFNSTKANVRVEKHSNNTMWNFALPPVFTKYFTFISSLFGIDVTGNKKQSTPVREDNRTIFSNVSDENVAGNASTLDILPGINGTIFQNITGNNNQSTLIREDVKKTIFSNVTDYNLAANASTIDILPGISEEIYQNLTKIFLPNSTALDHTSFKEYTLLNLTQNSYSSNETRLPVSPKNSRKAIIENNIRIPTVIASKILAETIASITFETPRKIDSENTVKVNNYSKIYISEKLGKIKDEHLSVTNSPKSTIKVVSKDFSNISISAIDKNSEQLSTTTGKDTSDILNFRSEENEGKLLKLDETMKFTPSSTGNLTKISREATSEKPEEFPEKTTLHFTIIDPNCTEAFLQNSSTNNSMDQSPSIVKVTAQVSTYPTIRRYSRNDSAVEKTGSTKNDVLYIQNNNAKNGQTKNSLNDSNLPNGVRRGRGGAIARGRMRSRYKGKDQYPSLPRIGKNSWRRNNGSAILNLSILPNLSTRPRNFGGSLVSRVNGKSTTKPDFGGFPDLLTLQPLNTDGSKINMTKIEGTIFYNKSTLSIPTEMMTNDIPRPTGLTPPAGDDLSKEENNLKNEWEPSTLSSRASTDFWAIKTTIRTNLTFPIAESKKEDDRIVADEILAKQKLFSDMSTLSYDKSIFADPSISMNTIKADQKVSNNSTDADFVRKEDMRSNEFDLSNSKNSKVNESLTTGLMFESSPPTKPPFFVSESKRDQESTIKIVNSTMTNESSTFSYDKSSFANSTIVNEIQSPTEKKITISELPSITENEILLDIQNTITTVDEAVGRDTRRIFVPDSMDNQTIANYTAAEKQKYYSVTNKLMALKYAVTPPYTNGEFDDSVNSQKSTEIYYPTIINKINKSTPIRDNIFFTKQEFSIATERIVALNNSILPTYTGTKNHETMRFAESSVNRSLHLENTSVVNSPLIMRYPDSIQQEFSTNEETVIAPVTESTPLVTSLNLYRKARDSRIIFDYEDRQEPEFDYDVDSLAEIEAVTEKTLNTREYNAEVPKAQERIFQELRRILSGYGAMLD